MVNVDDFIGIAAVCFAALEYSMSGKKKAQFVQESDQWSRCQFHFVDVAFAVVFVSKNFGDAVL